jgi:hypothetical protein
MKHGSLTLCVALATLVAGASAAAESPQLTACIHREVTFDGITPLTYATVTASAISRIGLHHEFPQTCSAADADACPSKAYLVNGDVVAIGKTCGEWVYVQYIGDAHIAIGWAARSHVTPLQRTLPFDDGTPPSHSTRFEPATVRMRLVQGHGTPVCEAYLQRLNQTVFHAPPYCGRPENDQVPGFARLSRVTMTFADYNKINPHVNWFEQSGHSAVTGEAEAMDAVKSSGSSNIHPTSWRYDPQVDIENNGVPINIIVWSEVSGWCGTRQWPDGTPTTAGFRESQQIFVQSLTDDGLDDAKSSQLFGHPTRGLSAEVPPDPILVNSPSFQPLGRSLSVFKYKGLVYFDTFFDGGGWADFEGKRAKVPTLDNHLAVFLRKNSVTRQVCEYVFDDAIKATPFR